MTARDARQLLTGLPVPTPEQLARNGRAPEGWCEAHETVHACCICDDGHFLLTADRKLAPCHCVDQNRPPFDARRFGIPARLANVTLDTWGPPNSRERIVAANYLLRWKPDRPWLTFLGPAGRGKTGLATGIVREAYERFGVGGYVTTVERALARFKATFDDDNRIETTEQVMQFLISRPLLVLDDLGAESGTKWAAEQVFSVVNSRYESMLATIITANEEWEGWQAMHPRVKSRLMDTTSGTVLRFAGPDRRLVAS